MIFPKRMLKHNLFGYYQNLILGRVQLSQCYSSMNLPVACLRSCFDHARVMVTVLDEFGVTRE